MSDPFTELLLGRDHPELGAYTVRTIERGALGTCAGRGPFKNLKRDPNEDGALAARRGTYRLAAVADSHFGADAATLALTELSRWIDRPVLDDPDAWVDLGVLLDDAVRAGRVAPSSATTFALAALDGLSLALLNIGDSLLLRLPRGGPAELLNTLTPVFVGQGHPFALAGSSRDLLREGLFELRELTLAEGDRLLLASDGLDELCSGLTLDDVASLSAQRPDPPEFAETLLRLGGCTPPGGRDNLTVVVLDV